MEVALKLDYVLEKCFKYTICGNEITYALRL